MTEEIFTGVRVRIQGRGRSPAPKVEDSRKDLVDRSDPRKDLVYRSDPTQKVVYRDRYHDRVVVKQPVVVKQEKPRWTPPKKVKKLGPSYNLKKPKLGNTNRSSYV